MAIRALILAALAALLMALTPLPNPFGSFAKGPGIVHAIYDDDLDIYPHRIMGHIHEQDTLRGIYRSGVDVGTGEKISFRLSLSNTNPGHVFEDIRPVLGDVDGDGETDVAVIETSLTRGASLAVYSMKNRRLVKIAQTPYVGQRNRWYAQVGIGDFNNDGQPDVAFVDRPHLARVLRVYSFVGGKFSEIASAKGLTNHAIGDTFTGGGVRTCDGNDQMVMEHADRGTIMVLWLKPDDDRIFGQDLKIKATPENYDKVMGCQS